MAYDKRILDNTGTTTSGSIAFGVENNANAGKTCIVFVAFGQSAYLSTVTDTKSNTWTVLTNTTAGTWNGGIAYTQMDGGTLTTSDTVTFTSNGAGSYSVQAVCTQYDGQLSPDVSSSNYDASGTVESISTGAAGTPTYAANLVFTGCATGVNKTLTVPTDFNLRTSGVGNCRVADLYTNQYTSWNPSWSWTGGTTAAAAVAVFKRVDEICTISAAGGNWNATGAWTEGVVPSSTKYVVAEGSSGNLTINTAAACRSFDLTNYTGTLTHNSAVTLSIGGTAAYAGDIAMKLVAGMTYTLGDNATSAISFVSTSTSQQTIDTAAKTLGNTTFNGSGGSWLCSTAITLSSTATMTLTTGTLNTNGYAMSVAKFYASGSTARVLTLGATTFTCTIDGGYTTVAAWDISTSTSMTLNANTSTIVLNGPNGQLFRGGGLTYSTVNLTGSGNVAISQANTFATLTRTGTAVKTDEFQLNANQIVTGTLTITGNSLTNRMHTRTGTLGTAYSLSAATVSLTNVDFMDITGAGAASPFTGTSIGRCGGCTNITVTSATTRYWVGDGGSWSDTAHWSASSGGVSGASVPLPHDTVIFDASSFSTGSQTITGDMPRIGANIDFSAVDSTPAWTPSVTYSLYGNLTMGSAMTYTVAQNAYYRGRGSHTITSAGKTLGGTIFRAYGGTYTLSDAFNNTGNNVILDNGTLTASASVNTSAFSSSNSNTRTLNMGANNWNMTRVTTGNFWDITTTTGMTLNASTSVITLINTSANDRTFIGGMGNTYHTLTYTLAGSTGLMQLGGVGETLTFNTINFSDVTNARTLSIGLIATINVTNFNVNGTSGKLMTIKSSADTFAHALNKTSGTVSCDYLSIRDSAAGGGAAWYAGANSTNVSNNTGWIFTGPPAGIMTTSKYW